MLRCVEAFKTSEMILSLSVSSTEMELSDCKEEPAKMTFDKESSLMVDLLLDDMDYEDETSAKLHAYVTGESVKPPPPPEQILFESGLPTSNLNGTLDMANSMCVSQSNCVMFSVILKIKTTLSRSTFSFGGMG